MDLKILKNEDDLLTVKFDKCDCFIHEHHRWVLPLLFYHQENNIIEKPCTAVIFDYHDDAYESKKKLEEIKKIRNDEISFDKLVEICQDLLSKNNDDWLIAGMELGLINNAVIFGTEQRSKNKDSITYRDSEGQLHYIEQRDRISLHYLCDRLPQENNEKLWEILSWKPAAIEHSDFSLIKRKFFLSIDLDCFSINWREFTFPWPDEVYENTLIKKTNHWSMNGWSVKLFFDALMKRTALLSIAKESDCCGGKGKSQIILNRVNKYFFDNKLFF